MSLKINERASVARTVALLWPKPDTRVPEAKREKPILDGTVECDFVYLDKKAAEAVDEQVESGEITHQERFAQLVPDIRGLPLETGQTAHEWLETHRYGAIVRNAIWEDYVAGMSEGRLGNSKKRRSS